MVLFIYYHYHARFRQLRLPTAPDSLFIKPAAYGDGGDIGADAFIMR